MEWWFWIVLGLGLLVLELATPSGFFLFFFGLSGLIVGLLVLAGVPLEAWLQWILFTVFAIGLVALLRQKILGAFAGKSGEVDSLVGQEVTIESPIAPGEIGNVSLRGAPWRAENVGASALTAGSRSQVVAVDGITLKIQQKI